MSVAVLPTNLDLSSPEALAHAANNRALAAELRGKVAKAVLGGDERSRDRHVSRGKLLLRGRVEGLLNSGAPLLKVGQLAANGMYGDEVPGARLLTAAATVPKLTVLMGSSFGVGNYGMCGRAYDPRFLFTGPNARISVMGGEQAASVLATVHRDAAKWSPEQAEASKAPIRQKHEDEGNPHYATARGWDDGIIDPAQTRDALALEACLEVPVPQRPAFGALRM